jgi:hypothetical protein
MAIDPESLYRQLGQLVAETPDLAGPITAETHRWLGRVAALVEEGGGTFDPITFTTASDSLLGPFQERYAHSIMAVLHRALARAELKAPAAAQGAFITVGAAFDVFQVIGKVLGEAKKDVLIVDPCMDAKVLTDFAPLAAEGVNIRLLTDSFYTKAEAVQPGAARWVLQYKTLRPLEIRFTADRKLHDRLIVVDGERVWSLTQSLKDFVRRSPASVIRIDGDMATLKRDAYEQMWSEAKPLTLQPIE